MIELSAEQRADAIAAAAPQEFRARIRDFARNIATQMDIDRGIIEPPETNDPYRIVGGSEVGAAEFPSCCCVGHPTGWCCTGALISPTVVITAAHCGANISRVMVGGNKVLPFMDSDAREINVRSVHRHEQYKGHPLNENDITILVLAAPANVETVPLATVDQLNDATEVELVGFGFNDPTQPLGFGTKRRVTVPLGPIRLSDEDEFGELTSLLGFHPEFEFVAGRKSLGKDSCNGDSGGPAYIQTGGRVALAGVTSRATREANVRCGDGGVYVRPDQFRDWINATASSAGGAPIH